MVGNRRMGHIMVSQANGCRRFEYMKEREGFDWAYLGRYCHVASSASSTDGGQGTCSADDVGLDR